MESKMRFSRLGVIAIIAVSILFTTNCSYYDRIMSRKNLVDGSHAYKERKFQVAEDLFRKAASRDPEGSTVEGRTAQLFLARTLHSEFIGDRKNTQKAEEAINEYKKALAVDKNDQSSYKAIASLYENLQRNDDWQKWVTDRANSTDIQPQHRAEALVSLAAKQNTCASEVTDTEKTKKTVKVNGKDVFQFTKPEDPAELERLRGCVDTGNQLIGQALSLEPANVKNAKNLDPKTMTDEQLRSEGDLLKVFESARSYNASLKVQAMRLAEMEGRTADRDRLKAEADEAKAQFTELSEVNRAIQSEVDSRKTAAEEAANANANANKAAANKK
jgi:tetratricopeptide (TPR) repeat protein